MQLQRKTGKQWSDTLTDTNHQIMTHSSSTSQTELLQPQSFKVFNNHMQPFCRFTRNSAEVTEITSQQRVRSILIQDQSEPFYILQQVARKVFNGRCCGQTHPKSLISLKDLYQWNMFMAFMCKEPAGSHLTQSWKNAYFNKSRVS